MRACRCDIALSCPRPSQWQGIAVAGPVPGLSYVHAQPLPRGLWCGSTLWVACAWAAAVQLFVPWMRPRAVDGWMGAQRVVMLRLAEALRPALRVIGTARRVLAGVHLLTRNPWASTVAHMENAGAVLAIALFCTRVDG